MKKNIFLLLVCFHLSTKLSSQNNAKISDLRDAFVGTYDPIKPPYSSFNFVYHFFVQKIATSVDSLIIYDSLWATTPTTSCPVSCYQHRVKLNPDSTWYQYGGYYGHFKKTDTIYLHFFMPGFPPQIFDYYGKKKIPLGVNELNVNSDIIISPNPSDDKLFFHVSDHIDFERVILTNVEGKEVLLSEANVHEIDVSKLPNGLYFLKIKTREGVLVKKVIILH